MDSALKDVDFTSSECLKHKNQNSHILEQKRELQEKLEAQDEFTDNLWSEIKDLKNKLSVEIDKSLTYKESYDSLYSALKNHDFKGCEC